MVCGRMGSYRPRGYATMLDRVRMVVVMGSCSRLIRLSRLQLLFLLFGRQSAALVAVWLS